MTVEAIGLPAETILVLSGPPGSGKTAVARALAEAAERSAVHLVSDSFYLAIRKGFVLPYLPEAAAQNDVVIGVIVASMLGYATGGYDVVVDGIVGPWSLPPFIDAAKRSRAAVSYVVLRPSFEQTFARAVAREGKALKASGPLKGLYGAFANLGPLERHVVDSTNDSVSATAQKICDGLIEGRFRL